MRTLILDESRGIYIPHKFILNFEGWKGIDPISEQILRAGPDSYYYWDAWDYVLQNATYTDSEGVTWSLEQDGDLFAVSENHYSETTDESEGEDSSNA